MRPKFGLWAIGRDLPNLSVSQVSSDAQIPLTASYSPSLRTVYLKSNT